MCFVLYIGTDQPIPDIPWNEKERKFNTQEIGDHDQTVAKHLNKRNKKYVGSDQGCGCGFRFVTFQSGEWPEEGMVAPNSDPDPDEQSNHQQLYDFIKELKEEEVELYGCWDGDFSEQSKGKKEISLTDLLKADFYFRERFNYTVTNSEPGSGGNG